MKKALFIGVWVLFGAIAVFAQPGKVRPFADRLVSAARERTQHQVTYDGAYRGIAYPGGDVPPHIGVCTDVVIRSYRALGHDLQVLVHEDMKAIFLCIPKLGSQKDRYQHRSPPRA